MKALIIDDDPIVTTLVTSMLKIKGYDIYSAVSEMTLKEVIGQSGSDFDLILIDLQLGEESGLNIFESYFKDIISLDKIIFMSANSEDDARSLYGLPSEAKFLEKPFRAPNLFSLI